MDDAEPANWFAVFWTACGGVHVQGLQSGGLVGGRTGCGGCVTATGCASATGCTNAATGCTAATDCGGWTTDAFSGSGCRVVGGVGTLL
jgi:hypothetical protein